jgi:hypothetical protein
MPAGRSGYPLWWQHGARQTAGTKRSVITHQRQPSVGQPSAARTRHATPQLLSRQVRLTVELSDVRRLTNKGPDRQPASVLCGSHSTELCLCVSSSSTLAGKQAATCVCWQLQGQVPQLCALQVLHVMVCCLLTPLLTYTKSPTLHPQRHQGYCQ